jgi:cytokinin riboside 5'-monophosphate phosphoribohydrolase
MRWLHGRARHRPAGEQNSFNQSTITEQVARSIDLVYGGGSIGLMGLVSQAVYGGGRHVIG